MSFLNPRWQKVIRDILGNKSRTALVVVATAVGVFAFGSMFITREVLLDNMNSGFQMTNPATIIVGLAPFDEDLVRTVRNFPYVQEAAARASVEVQVYTGSTWTFMTLIAVPDFAEIDINTLSLEAGTLQPARREVLLERQSMLQLNGAQLGDDLLIELPDSAQRELRIVGVVHDFVAVPASRIPILTGYVSLDTLVEMGLSPNYNELQIVTDPSLRTELDVDAAADEIADLLTRYGYRVRDVTVLAPGQHWAADFIEAVVLVLIILGSLSLALSGLLVVNTITAILGQQKRQIGMMKAVGARTRDVMGIYLVLSGTYGVLSLLIALPVGMLLSRLMVVTLADFLNANIMHFDPPAWVIALQVGAALFVPLLAAFIPILAGTRTTVREAISDYGINVAGFNPNGLVNRLVMRLRSASRPVLISLRNTFRQRGRLALTLVTLSLAGGIFIAVLNTRRSVLLEFDQILAMFGYDVQVVLTDPQQVSRLRREAMRVPGVRRVEGWGFAQGIIIRPDGVLVPTAEAINSPNRPRDRSGLTDTERDEGTAVTIFAPPLDTQFMKPTVLEGRWLQPGDTDAIVLASEVITLEPWIKVGDRLRFKFGATYRTLEVVGIVKLVGPEFGYASFDYITRLRGAAGMSRLAMLGTLSRDVDYQQTVARAVEERFQDTGIGVMQTATPSSFIGVITEQVDFFVLFMLFMAILLGVVGGLGLATTMSLNVLERTREIGVMRAIGASDGQLRGIIMTEGLVIGAISYAIACILSVPITLGFIVGVGNAFFNRPLGFYVTPLGFGAWFVIAVLLATAASLVPAQRAAAISVREALAYE